MEPIIEIAVEIAIFIFGFAFLVIQLGYRGTTISATIRESLNNLKKVESCAKEASNAIKSASTELEKQVQTFVKAQKIARLNTAPLESLKEAGASNVRWTALRQAGFTTLVEIIAADKRKLMAIPGVGQTTAERVIQAARTLAAQINSKEPAPPSADLTEPLSEELAARALHLLHTKDLLVGVPRQLNSDVAKFRDRFKSIRHEASFVNWVRSKGAFATDSQAEAEAQVLLMETYEFVESKSVKSTSNHVKYLKDEAQRPPTQSKISEEFRDRYADCIALIERVLSGKNYSFDTLGGIPADVVERTEKIKLETDGLRVTLRQYQEFGAKYLLAQERTILGDEMGLGKTIEALTVMNHLNVTNTGTGHYLVVAPASLTRNWMSEITERTHLQGYLLHGQESDRRREFDRWIKLGGVAVTAYTTLASLKKLVTAVPIQFLVLDEAHYVKNPEAKRTGLVKRLVDTAARVCLLTGTPIENHPREFVNLVEIIQPKLANELRDTLNSNEVIGASRFKVSVAGAYLRRNQKDVLKELPEKIEVPSWVDMEPDDSVAYQAAVADGKFHMMRRIAILGAGKRPSSKIDRLVEIINEHRTEGRKVLVFTFFTDVLEAIRNSVETIGTLEGCVPMPRRMALVEKFQKLKGHAVLPCQINVGGVGLNLQAASAIILMEPQWKPSTEEQAIARAHRMGQTRSVLVHRLLTKDSVEGRMIEILDGKSELFKLYAADSSVKNASVAATETRLVDMVMAAERTRLAEEVTA